MSPAARAVRIVASLLLVAFIVIAVLVALAVPAVLAVRERLDDGRAAMEQARAAVVAGDVERALDRFRAARSSFDDASERSRAGVLGLMSGFPVLGANVDAVGGLADAGSKTARAGIEVARAVGSLQGGVDALAPRHGRIPLERFPPLARAVGRAHALVASAVDDAGRSADAAMLLPPVEDASVQARAALASLEATLSAGARILDRLPAFFGGDGPRTYLFGAENPAELRGSGGLIGAFALLTADDGRLSFSSFRAVQDLPLLDPATVRAPNPDYHRLYDPQRTGNGFWLNANMTPDFPSAARALEAGYEAATHRPVDGVVTADPFALRALLQVTGPATVPDVGTVVTARSVVPFLANRAYTRLADPDRRKAVLGAVAASVVERFLATGGDARAVRALVDAAAESHVKVYADDPELEAALSSTGAGGAFLGGAEPAAGSAADLLSIVVNNGAANKLDYYVDRSVRYAITLHDDRTASAVTQVRFANHAPDVGLPRYVIGPNAAATDRPGQDRSIVNVYCGRCRPTGAMRDGRSIRPGIGRELASTFVQDSFTVDAGDAVTNRVTYDLPSAWAGDASGGTYTLRFLNQPTIRPTTVDVRIRVPDGMSVTNASGGVRVDGSVARWTGRPGRTLTIEVSFAPPLPVRLWHELVG